MEENTASIQLPESLVKKAEDEGLNVSKSCEVAPKNIRRFKERVLHLLNGIIMGLRNSEYNRVSELREELTNSVQKWSNYFYSKSTTIGTTDTDSERLIRL